MPATGFVTDAEIIDVLNDEWPEVYRLLIEVGPPDYYSSSTNVSVVAGTTAYALPADFYQETTVYLVDGVYKRPLVPVQDWALARVRAPQASYTVTMEYVPTPTLLTAGADTVDGILGFDSLLSCRCARRLLQKRKADHSSLDAEIGQLTGHLKEGARRSKGPRYMRDVNDARAGLYQSLATAVTMYRLRAANIEVYEPAMVLGAA
jgi:hypothetical protein